MLSIVQLNNKIGGAEVKSKVLYDFLRKDTSNIDLFLARKLLGILYYLTYWLSAIKILSKLFIYKKYNAYLMIHISPKNLFEAVYLTYPFILCGQLFKLCGQKLFVRQTLNDSWVQIKRYVPKVLLKNLYYIASGEDIYNVLTKDLGNNKVFKVIDGIKTDLFKPAKKSKNYKFVFGYIGRLDPIKNIDLLIKAYAMLPRNIKSKSILKIIGYQPNCCKNCTAYFMRLKLLAKEYKVQNNVIFLNALRANSKELVAAYNSIDVFVFPSKAEGYANSVLEALSCGLPVISWKYCYGVREIVNKNIGWQFESLNAKDLVSKLKEAYKTELRSYKENARRYTLENFNIKNTFVAYKKVFMEK